MIYFVSALIIVIIIAAYIYYKPEKKVTKNVFNAEYYRGLNFLLNNQEDRAFKIFTALMDVDSSTIETHLALGGLYRKRGEFDKAILIHQNLLSRPTLEQELKNQALYELAKDFQSAGLYDRSEKIYKNLSEYSSYALSCSEELVKLYEVTKDWDKAIEIVRRSKSDEINNHNKDLLVSQYLCEISSSHYNNSEIEKAVVVSKKALKVSESSIRAYLQLAKYYSDRDSKMSVNYYANAINVDRSFAKYIVSKILSLSRQESNEDSIKSTILAISHDKSLEFIPDIYIYLYYEKDEDTAQKYLQKYKGNSDYEEFIINSTIVFSDTGDVVKTSTLDNMIDSYKKIFNKGFIFLCKTCGYKSNVLNWLCPSCNNWSSSTPKTTFDMIDDGAKNVR